MKTTADFISAAVRSIARIFGSSLRDKGPGDRSRRKFGAAVARVCETLECRRLLAVISGVPVWQFDGPSPIVDGGSAIPGAPAQNGASDQSNPVIGAIQALAPDPSHPNILYVGTVNNGIWVTHDATDTDPFANSLPMWTSLTLQYPSLSIGSLALDPLDPSHQTLFAGLGRTSSAYYDGGPGTGVMKTIDGGKSWTTVAQSLFSGLAVNHIFPTTLTTSQGQLILAEASVPGGGSASGGVFLSPDGGTTWTRISGAAGTNLPADGYPAGVGESGVTIDPSNNHILYAAVPGKGVFLSNSSDPNKVGTTWVPVNGDLPPAIIAQSNYMDVAAGANSVFAAFFNSASSTPLGFFHSTNSGATWTPIDIPNDPNDSDQGGYPYLGHMSVDPSNPNVIYVAGGQVPAGGPYREDVSQPRGSQVTLVVGSGANGTSPHADARDFAWDAQGNFLQSDDGGVYRLVHPASSSRVWQSVIGNIIATEFYSVAWDSVNHVAIGASQDNGVEQQYGGIDFLGWTTALQGDGYEVAIYNSPAIDFLDIPAFSIHYY
ncbi:MAG: WD40/YVTN/BNR-like repeat-containing protein, partial [Tepidisphaerales bacterium]